MKAQLIIPQEVLEQLIKGTSVASILVEISVQKPEDREDAIRKSAKEKARKDKYTLSKDDFILINKWNSNPLVCDKSEQDDIDGKNMPITQKEINRNSPIIKKAIRVLTVDILTTQMDKYFAQCDRGEHIWNGRNHAFRTLLGFLHRMIDTKRPGKEKTWWMLQRSIEETPIKDPNEVLTQGVADAYARAFLGKKRYILVNPSRDYRHFAIVAKNLVKEKRFPEDKALKIFIEAVRAGYNSLVSEGKPIMPGHLSSMTTWKIVFPQYIAQMLGGNGE